MPKWKTMQYVPMQADQIWRDRIYSEKNINNQNDRELYL